MVHLKFILATKDNNLRKKKTAHCGHLSLKIFPSYSCHAHNMHVTFSNKIGYFIGEYKEKTVSTLWKKANQR